MTACAVFLAAAFFCPLGFPKPFDRKLFTEAALVVASSSTLSARQAIRLPVRLQTLSATGEAYFTISGGQQVVFIPSWVGRRTLLGGDDYWLEGFLFDPSSDKGLDSAWDISSPAFEPFWSKEMGSSGSTTVLSDDDLGHGWYHVTVFPD